MSSAPRVEGVRLVSYLGKGIDLKSAATHVGSYATGIGTPTHDVYDLPTSALHELVRAQIPDTIASSPDGAVLRLYVPRSQHGQITDIGIVNGVYKAPGAPLVPRQGPIYTAPADLAKYHAVAPPRPPKMLSGGYHIDDGWQPGPGDRFRVNEVW